MILEALWTKFGKDWMKFVGVSKKKCENICVGGNGCGLFGQRGVEREKWFCFEVSWFDVFFFSFWCHTYAKPPLQQIILKSDCCWHILLSRGHEPLKLSDILATAGLSLSYELFLALKGVAAWVKYITTSNYSSVWQQLLTNAMSHLRWHLKCYNLNNSVIMAGTS